MGPPCSCRPQMGPMLAPWTLRKGSPWMPLKQRARIEEGVRRPSHHHIYGLVQNFSTSSALAMEIVQSCTKPSIYWSSGICYWGYTSHDLVTFPVVMWSKCDLSVSGTCFRYLKVLYACTVPISYNKFNVDYMRCCVIFTQTLLQLRNPQPGQCRGQV